MDNGRKGKVLVLSTSRKTRGGITAVLKIYEQSEMWRKYGCIWVGTHRDGNKIRKMVYYVVGVIRYIILLPFFDIIHFHVSLRKTVKRKYPLFKLAKMFGKKTIIHLHCGSQIDDIWNDQYQYIFERCDCCIVLSESLKKKVAVYIGSPEKIKVVYNPCPLVNNDGKYVKKNHILFSGTLYDGKGYKDLIRAFAKVANKYPDWKIVFAGNGEVEQAKKMANDLGILEKVELLGWVNGEAKYKAFCEAKALCLPSYAEGFPMAVLDAWAFGLPVITTPVGGIPDVAKDGSNMLIFNPGDIDNLAIKLDMIMGDFSLRERLTSESYLLAKNQFSLDNISEQVAAIYEELLNNRK